MDAMNAAQAERNYHKREFRPVDIDFKCAVMRNHHLSVKTEDLENELRKIYYDKMTMELINHGLIDDRDNLHHYLNKEVRSFLREEQVLKKVFYHQIELKKLKNDMELEIANRKAVDVKQILEKKIEKLNDETAKLTKSISNKEAEISDQKIKFIEEMDEHETQLIEESEEIIRNIQAEHYQRKMDRNQVMKKLEEEKKSLTRNIEDLQLENEEKFLQTFVTTMQEVNEKWGRLYVILKEQKTNKEKTLSATILDLETKMKGEIDATEIKYRRRKMI